jgi:type I restriction enzyme S subunit
MSFPRYPKYKASGAEWLGDVPEGWEVKRSDSFLTYSRDQLDPKEFQGLEVFHYSIPVVQETGTGQIEDGAEIASGKQIVKKQVVLVSKLNPRKGTICIAEPQQALTLCSTEFVALEPNGCDIRYLSYLVRTEGFRQGLESKVTSVTNSHQRANPVDIYRFWNAWPVLPEQTAIAEFLDRETGKIDELVAEQRRLMELLKEKRQAVISRAVTKGLNPHAPMKPSGIEWLGDVPEHWSVGKCGFYLTILSGFAFPSAGFSRNESDTKLLRGINVGVARLRWDETVYWQRLPGDGLDNYEMKAGDLVIGMDRPLIGEGMRVAKVEESDLPCLLLQRVASLKMGGALNSSFLFHLISSEMFVAHFSPDTTGVSVPHISPEQIENFVIPLPPIGEQHAIVAFLVTELAKFDTLTAEAKLAIDLLQERRTALISAAVTGQIDVRQTPKN